MNNSGSVRSGRLSTWGVQWRVIYALIMREIITRFGRNNLGFLWLIIEPMVFSVVVITFRTLFHQSFHGVELAPFLMIGYTNITLWRFCISRGLRAIDANRSLLHYRQIRIQDIFLARMLLELTGVTLSFLVLWTIFAFLELATWPADPFLMATGWLLACWFSASFGAFMGCLSEFSELVARLWPAINYSALLAGGIFFRVDWLPKAAQEWVLLFPLVHHIEMTRAAYWGDSAHWHYSVLYMIGVCMTLTLLAGILMRNRTLRTPHL